MERTGTSTAPYAVVCSFDTAVDATQGDYTAYLSTRDPERLAYHSGEKPAVFWCRRLTRDEIREVRNAATQGDRYEAAFVRGVTKVVNLVHRDGAQRDWLRPDDAKVIPQSGLDYFDESEIQEVGMVIASRSLLGKALAGYFPLPGISHDALRAHTRPRAGQTIDSSTSVPPKPAAEEPPPAT